MKQLPFQQRKMTALDIVQLPLPPEDQIENRTVLARQQAKAAVELLRGGQAEPVWALFRHHADPTLRSYLVALTARWGAPAEVIVRQVLSETDVSARRALILTLGGFTAEQLPAPLRRSLTARLLEWYRNDRDPGIHSAISWLLRYGQQGRTPRVLDWQQADALHAIDRELAGRPAGGRGWYITREGQTMSIVPGPVEFVMGSPAYESGRLAQYESPHRKRIPRSFAIAATEVTVGQYQRFLEATPTAKQSAEAALDRTPLRDGRAIRRLSPEDNCPQINVTWYDAAQYCNWLSAREGIPPREWCYPPLDRIGDGMEMPPGYLHRTGYRMPTEAEWEYACRAGATARRFFGTPDELLKEYVWYTDTTGDERTWPVGQLKPNDLGLFDMHGSVWEWCQSPWTAYPEGDNGISEDREETSRRITNAQPRIRRGGSFIYEASVMRSAGRGNGGGYIPQERRDNVGFRIARTYPQPIPT
jgi:formylglycine-generating enzyme required for sulfatase activity